MRYGSWDVLLFPHGSKTPMQEFRTQCFVTRDNDVPFIHDPSFAGVRYISDGRPLTQLPVLTTFVGSLSHNAPFRVSIHSWEQPQASRMLENLARPGDSVTFEARVYIDGVMVASSLFNQRTMWPHVIDLCSQVDREGFQEPLLFPPFHQEILQASSWDAGQLLGRVRIVVTEGFSRETNPPHNNLKHSFVRIRDILAFSFQHAPTHILEFSGIAWPNPGMWAHAQSRNVQGPVSSAPRALVADTKEDGDAHAHSPRRPSHEDVCSSGGISNKRYLDHEDHWAHQSMAPPSNRLDATGWNQSQQRESNMIRQNGPLADPFLEPCAPSTATVRRGTKKSSEDTPMPDASSYESSRNITGMTGLGYEQKGMPLHNIASHEAIMNQLVEALSPLKSDDDGPHNTTNTPSSGRVFSRPSAAAQARATTRRVTGPARGSPGTDRNERHTVDTSVVDSTKIISSHPVGSVQSKKEGEDNKENTPDHRVAGADYTGCSSLGHNVIYMKSSERLAGSSDSKRKRPLEEVPDPVCRSSINNSMSPSPSKKMSKGASAECLAKGRSPHTPGEGRELNGGVSLKAAAGA